MILPETDDEIAAYVATALAALDATPRDKRWRVKAAGRRVDALADIPNLTVDVHLRVPVGEMRLLRDECKRRGLGMETMLRRGFGTWLVATGPLTADDLPFLTRGGLLR